ncbi:hypothetical protein CR513_35151, partial [Mucuna pruriens]
MTYDKESFNTEVKWVKIGNDEHISVKGKRNSYNKLGIKVPIDVLYVLGIDHNLLNLGQLLEKGFKVIFENNRCIIKDLAGQEMFKVKMKSKSFSLDPIKEEHVAFPVTTNSIDL